MAWDYLIEFIKVFVDGLTSIFYSKNNFRSGIIGGLIEMFNLSEYKMVLDSFKLENPTTKDWIIMISGIIIITLVLLSIFIVLAYYLIRFFKRIFSKEVNSDLVKEIARLRGELKKSEKDKERLFKLKLQGKENSLNMFSEPKDYDNEYKVNHNATSRFSKLIDLDNEYKKPRVIEFNNQINLKEICESFRTFAANKLNLYYDINLIRLFIASLATTHVIILQGISGTGKTSLPYAFGMWLDNPATIASVQPSWRDRTEIFGYFNEFTKRFNETEILRKMYEARYNDEIYITVIDEANIARVEYYFAELLSTLEIPDENYRIVDIAPSGWDNDPKLLEKGRFKIPSNMWYIFTINNDDSTFAISDKVYDRAIPININNKCVPFTSEAGCESVKLNYQYLEDLYVSAKNINEISEDNIKKIDMLDEYLIKNFEIAFGNRIVKQINDFIPVYIACGGNEMDGIDYLLCNKILRKLESLNLNFNRKDIEELISFLDLTFGSNSMRECKEYLSRLLKKK